MRKKRKAIRCGVIGYGGAFDMGKMHGEMLNATRGLNLVAACDLDATRMDAAKKDFHGIETFTSVKRMLAMEELDLVTLITPHCTHGPLAVQCANAGKHVITEKPMCLTVKEADAMIQAGKRNKVMVSVFHNRRWDGDYVVLRKLIEEGEIGEVFQIDCFSGGYERPGSWWRSDKTISGGILYDWGAHFFDWILNLIPSPVVSVSGHFQKREWQEVTNEDHALVVLRFKNGAVGTFEQSSLAAAPKDRWRVLGTKGAITLRDWDQDHWIVTSHSSGRARTKKVRFKKDDWGAYYRNIARHG
jgi:predicted dehydrogenase